MVGESSTVADLIASGDIEFIQDGNHGGNYPKSTEFVDSGIPLITGACLEDGRVNLNKASFLKQDRAESLRVGFAKTGDVLLSHKGTMGKTAIVPEIESPYIILNPQLTLYRINPNGRLKAQFLRYFFDSAFFQSHIVNISATSTINTLPVFEQKRLLIPIPEIQLQEQIIRHVGSLDDKIELNRRINETLEGMAQALFKSWFVDFDPVIDNALAAGNPIPETFAQRAETRRQAIANGTANRETAQAFPASFRFTEELGWIPDGWEAGILSELLDVKYGKDHKKLGDGNIPVYGSGGLMRFAESSLYEGESVLIPRKGTLSNILYLNEKFWTVDTMFYTIPKRSSVAKFSYYHLKGLDFTSMNVGSAVPSMTTKVLNDLPIISPAQTILDKFDNFIGTYYRKSENKKLESQTLAKLRDTLLPKLISGELRIPQAEKRVEEAVA